MKKSLFLIPALALGLSLASCSNDDSVNTSPAVDGDFGSNYLCINIAQASENATRDDESSSNPEYENGTTFENSVKKVRFYFFNSEDKAAAIKADKSNYFDWENLGNDGSQQELPSTSGSTETENVEKILQATVVISTEEGDGLPTKILAILNPDEEKLGDKNLDLSDLRILNKDYATTVNGGNPSNFVMTNSVYADGESEVVATEITSANYGNTPDAAKANPVQIYVERCVAKVNLSINIDSKTDYSTYDTSSKLFTLKDKEGNEIKVKVGNNSEEKQVYLSLDAWGLTADTDKGNLIKSISPSDWSATTSKVFEGWNNPNYFRSFWANNATKAEQSWHKYSDVKATLPGYLYANENAPQVVYNEDYKSEFNADQFTKVIIAGTLQVDVNGTKEQVTIAKYAGQIFAGLDLEETETALKNAIVNALGTNMIYYKDEEGFKELRADHLVFKTALELNDEIKGEKNQGRYNVYLQLSKDAATKEWYKNDKATEFDKTNTVDSYLISTIGRAQIYNGGKTYFYFPINHLGKEKEIGDYGVVRNHLYKCSIVALAGLGTPVYNPEEDIYPEHPEDDDTFIAAQINILSWRIVKDDVSLIW